MPKIYQYINFILFFYANEHLPIHCHIKRGDREIKAEIAYVNGKLVVTFRKIKGKVILTDNEISTIEEFIKWKHLQIVEKWTSFFVFGKKPKFEKLNKKQ